MRCAPPNLYLALLGLALGPGVAPGTPASESPDPLLELLEFLGEEGTASEAWGVFVDGLPPRPDDQAPLPTVPEVTGEPGL